MSELRLIDVVEALKKRGRDNEAEYWRLVVAIELGAKHDIPEDEILDLPMEKIYFLMQVDPSPQDWTTWTWGRAAVEQMVKERE